MERGGRGYDEGRADRKGEGKKKRWKECEKGRGDRKGGGKGQGEGGAMAGSRRSDGNRRVEEIERDEGGVDKMGGWGKEERSEE